ncbi:MAG: ribonuclease HI [Actinomycetia bacterium]|nr:ribonuclease HI [Actinomycetes bacterium]
MPEFECRDCGTSFTLPESILKRYPGWTPRQCRDCRSGESSNQSRSESEIGSSGGGPRTGVFTDGSSSPNPGPGGWGAVYVKENEIIDEAYGYGGETTNNRMELLALIEAASLVPEGTPATVYSDSNLAVRTINEWAAGWEKKGWRRKSGPVQNLDLVKEAYRVYRQRPNLDVTWIKAHVGFRWNEYADELANRGRLEGSR